MQRQYDVRSNELPLLPLYKNEGVGGVHILQKDKCMCAHKGQSTVEYILLVTAVVMVVVMFTVGSGSLFQQRLNSVFNTTTQDMLNVASYLQQNAAP
ncbi:MAG: class III signal peptide-containing protein [Candidatus Omnitrophica bacterium]|nr:class III signal peptide-containing protein [Candidatus Omnitrophota bacterium]